MSYNQIERETLIAAPVERVWSVLTEAEHLSAWFADAGAEIDLRPGGTFVLHWATMPASIGRVEAVEPPHRFAYRWTAHHAAGEQPTDGNSTLVEFTLTEQGDGTLLRVVESGFEALATGVEQQRGNYEANTGGWASKTEQLAAYATQVPA